MEAQPTLDQLQVFLAVAETGSFSAAARRLNRAQSVISYAIANLEAQLEVTLFTRGTARQPDLTDAGRALLSDTRRLIADLDVLRSRAKSIRQGLEGEVSLALSVMVPNDIVVTELKSLALSTLSVGLIDETINANEFNNIDYVRITLIQA